MTLAADLRETADLLDAGFLSGSTVSRLAAVNSLVQRDLAILELMELLDPAGKLSAWNRAGILSDRLRRFEATAWPRVLAGAREPRDAIERAMTRVLRCNNCPLSQRRLFELISDATPSVNC